MSSHATLTRRSLLAGSFVAGMSTNRMPAESGTPVATPKAFDWPDPVDIGKGL